MRARRAGVHEPGSSIQRGTKAMCVRARMHALVQRASVSVGAVQHRDARFMSRTQVLSRSVSRPASMAPNAATWVKDCTDARISPQYAWRATHA
jgi:hypothetical protein